MLFAFLPFFSCQSTFRLKFFLLSLPPSLPSFFLGFVEHTLGQSVSCKIGGLEYWLLQTEAYLQTEEGSDFVFNVFKESTYTCIKNAHMINNFTYSFFSIKYCDELRRIKVP